MPHRTTADPATQLLIDKRIRITHGRRFVLQLMLQAPNECWDTDRICLVSVEHGDHMRPNSVYRILRDLTEAGVLQREWRPGVSGMKAGYRLAETGLPCAPQLVCHICERTVSIDDDELCQQLLRLAERHAMGNRQQPLKLMSICQRH